MRVYQFTVKGCGSFPFKQLWRDQAWPASERDSELLELACPTQAREQTIGFLSYAHPNAAMWREQKWPVQRVFA
jgi:hypothetical protein